MTSNKGCNPRPLITHPPLMASMLFTAQSSFNRPLGAPTAMSLPIGRIHFPDGTLDLITTEALSVDKAVFSTGTTASAPGGTGAPVVMYATFPAVKVVPCGSAPAVTADAIGYSPSPSAATTAYLRVTREERFYSHSQPSQSLCLKRIKCVTHVEFSPPTVHALLKRCGFSSYNKTYPSMMEAANPGTGCAATTSSASTLPSSIAGSFSRSTETTRTAVLASSKTVRNAESIGTIGHFDMLIKVFLVGAKLILSCRRRKLEPLHKSVMEFISPEG